MASFDGWAQSYRGGLEDPAKHVLAGTYGHLVRMKLRLLEKIRRGSFGSRSVRVLDFGCGTGEIAAGLTGLSGVDRVDGVDESAGMIREAARRHARLSKKKLRWRWLRKGTLPRGGYDWIVVINTLHHLAPSRRIPTVKKLIRCLAPGGVISILEHNGRHPLTRWVVARCPFDRGVKLLDEHEARSLAALAGGCLQSLHLGMVPPWITGAALLENLLGKLPLGVQFVVWAQKPSSSG